MSHSFLDLFLLWHCILLSLSSKTNIYISSNIIFESCSRTSTYNTYICAKCTPESMIRTRENLIAVVVILSGYSLNQT